VQKAIDSGILNNTRKTHEMVDMIAKISAEKGIEFDFANNEKLKETGFALEGKTVNGYVTKDGNIVLNLNSANYLNSVVGHELTHVLEGSDLYDALQKEIVKYAKSKGEYDDRLRRAIDLYSNVDGYKGADGQAAIEKELVADLVGDYIFTDAEFVRNLHNNNRNVFQKIWDEIKYLYKVATAGSKEAKQLEQVKHLFEKVYQEGGKATGEVKYSLTEPFTDLNGTHFENAVLLDTDFFDGISPRNWGDKLQDEVNRRASTNPLIMPIVDENGNTTLLQFASPKETVRKNGGSKHNVLDELSRTSDNISKLAVIHIDEIVSVSEENSPYFTQGNEHGWMDKNGWLHRNANVINQKNGNIYNLTVDIAKTADGRTILYATKGKIKKVGTVKVNSLKIKGSRQNSNFSDILPQKEDSVKGYSLSAEDETPIKRGNLNIKGEDVLLEVPIRDDISKAETTEDIAPIRDDIANVVEEENNKKARLSRSIKRIYRNFEQDKADLQEEINLRRDKLPINDDSGHYALDQEYQSRLKELELQAETKVKNAKTAEQRRVKHENLQAKIERIAGDISTWVDKKFGFSYKTNTLRRNLRDIVRDENGNRDIAKADEIYELLQGNYNKHEAELNREANRIKKVYADMKITDAESTYIQMLGEFRHNPDTQLKKEDVDKFLLENKSKIDEAKVDKAIELARETYDSLLVRVNEALREAGMKEIPYRKGYFPHFTEDKQGWLAKLFNWKTQNNDIPTDIAGITEQFNPNRTYQPFNKQRKSDTTDYNFLKVWITTSLVRLIGFITSRISKQDENLKISSVIATVKRVSVRKLLQSELMTSLMLMKCKTRSILYMQRRQIH
jgi:hypothetical protein